MNFDTAPRSFDLVPSQVRAPDGAAWCALAINRGLVGNGSLPVHRLGLDWRRTANSILDAFHAHELASVTAEMQRIASALDGKQPGDL